MDGLVDFVCEIIVVGDCDRWVWDLVGLKGCHLLNQPGVVAVAKDSGWVGWDMCFHSFQIFFKECEGC